MRARALAIALVGALPLTACDLGLDGFVYATTAGSVATGATGGASTAGADTTGAASTTTGASTGRAATTTGAVGTSATTIGATTSGATTVGATTSGSATTGGSSGCGTLTQIASSAPFQDPAGLALLGSQLFVADTGKIWTVDVSNGTHSTLISSGPQVAEPTALALADGGLLVGDDGSDVYLISTTTGQGNDVTPGFASGGNLYTGLASDGQTVYFGDPVCIRRFSLSSPGTPPALLGNQNCSSNPEGYVDGPIASAEFQLDSNGDPQAMAYDPVRDTLYVADFGNNVIRAIAFSVDGGWVSTFGVAGNGNAGDKDGPAQSAGFVDPVAVAVDAAGDVFVAETAGGAIREIQFSASSATVSTPFTNNQNQNPNCDTSLGLDSFVGLAADPSGKTLYVTDSEFPGVYTLTGF